MQITSIILAAGSSTRMGTDKAMLKINGQTLLDIILTNVLPFSEFVIVVCGKNFSTLKKLKYPRSVELIRNPKPHRGMFSSLQIATKEVVTFYALIHPIDLPFIKQSTYQKLINALNEEQIAFIPTLSTKKRSGHPIIINRLLMEIINHTDIDSNLRNILHSLSPKAIKPIPVKDPHILDNINTPEDLNNILSP